MAARLASPVSRDHAHCCLEMLATTEKVPSQPQQWHPPRGKPVFRPRPVRIGRRTAWQ